jgi:hypothetical protein
MIKTIIEFSTDLTDEELGKLIKMSVSVMKHEEVSETDNRVINYLFKSQFRPAAERYVRNSKINSENGKKGGRTKKKGKELEDGNGNK